MLETIGKIYQKIGGVENLQKATETYLRVHSLATETRNSSMQESARKNLEEIRATISSTYGSEHGLEHNPDAARVFSLAEAPMPSLAAPAGFSFGLTISAASAVPLVKQLSLKRR